MIASQLTSELQSSREALFEPLRGLTEEQFRYTPADGDGWNIAAHLAHLLRIERVFAERADRALTELELRIASTAALNDDDPGLAQTLAVPQIIHGMQATRRSLEDVLDRCDAAALDRVIVHERIGRMTITQIAEKMAGHEREHAAAVADLARNAPRARRIEIPLMDRA